MVRFDEVGVRPEPGDNVAIASRRLEAGTEIELGGTTVTLPHTVLEGHRFVIEPVGPGEALTSWNTPFARASRHRSRGRISSPRIRALSGSDESIGPIMSHSAPAST